MSVTLPYGSSLRTSIIKDHFLSFNSYVTTGACPRLREFRSYQLDDHTYSILKPIGSGIPSGSISFLVKDENQKTLVMRRTRTAWEFYIFHVLNERMMIDPFRMTVLEECIDKPDDVIIYQDGCILIHPFSKFGTLMKCVNEVQDWHVVCFIMTQLARILKMVHDAKIIHGNICSKNILISRKIDLKWEKESLLSTDPYIIKITDWERSIDMDPLEGNVFGGRAGVMGPEMEEGLSYQADYYGYAQILVSLVSGEKAILTKDPFGVYHYKNEISATNPLHDTVFSITKEFLNIRSCDSLPNWNNVMDQLAQVWEENFSTSQWKSAVNKFNEACDDVSRAQQYDKYVKISQSFV